MKNIAVTMAAVVSAGSAFAWKVPNWTTIVTEPGAIQEQYGQTKKWCGHVQGMCVSSNAIYFSFHDQIVKTDWYGRLLNRVPVDPHGGDICLWNGKLYTGVWHVKKGEKSYGAIYMYDADTLELLKAQKVKSKDAGVDGITVLDGVIYLAMGATGKYDPETKSGRTCWYGKFKTETLEQIGEPFGEDHGDDSLCGSQNMCTDGKYIYSSHYTYDEAARTPNVVVHDKDTFKVVAKCRFGWNHGIDVVPGGKDGAVRFAWVFTPNWIGRLCKKENLPLYGIVQFVELKDGQVIDFTEHGAGFGKEIER